MQAGPMQPRWYQTEAVEAPFAYWSRDNLPDLASPCIEVPTGGGKSAIIGWTARRLVEDHDARVIVASHRSELIEQDAADMREVWPDAPIGIYSAGLGRREWHSRVVIAGVQSAYRNAAKFGHRDVMIVDEAHLVNADEGTQYWRLIDGLRKINSDMRLIGYTATPYRLGQGYVTSGETALFTAIPYRVSVRRLIDEGFLSPLVTGSPSTTIDTADLTVRAGEFVARDLELACNVQEITDHVADDVAAALTSRRLALVYGVSVSHAAMLRNTLRMRGIPTEMIDGSMDRPARRQIIQAFKAGEIRALTSCDVLTTGFNVPAVDVVALVRPTQSTALYVQILGRGMRTAPGKTDCLVLDYGANIARHGPVDAVKPRSPSKRSEEDATAPVKECPTCCADVPTACRECPHCGHLFPPPERKANKAASYLPALTIKVPAKKSTHDVGSHTVQVHRKKSSDGPLTVRLDYFEPDTDNQIGPKIASEWLCVEHEPGSFPHRKWVQWWQTNVATRPLPESAEEAVKRLCSQEFPRPLKIVVEPDGEFTRVVKMLQDKPREPGEDDDEPEDAPDDPFGDDDLPF
jgi:DNA repair protein RadD